MTNPTPHGQVPEALIDLIDAYAETRHRCGGIYNAKTEAARSAVIEALSGVQALSAGPATPPAEQQAPSAAAADTVVLEAALRAIHQAIDLIGEPDTERLRTVRRVLRGAVIVAEDAGEAATAPKPAPAPLSDDTKRLNWLLWKLPGDALRYVVGELSDTSSGAEFRAAIDAALAAQGGE